jgi:SAM-dependent methyltransferase
LNNKPKQKKNNIVKNNLTKEEKEIISNIFTEKYYEVTFFNGIPYVSHLILELFDNTGILNLLKYSYVSVDEIITRLNFIPKAKFTLSWMLSFLNQYNFLKKAENSSIAQYHYDNACHIDPKKFVRPSELDEKIIPSCNLMEYAIREYPKFFKGSKTGFEIIFASNKIVLWNEYFSNDNSGYSVYNSLGAFGILKWLLQKNKIKLLELGGGTGSASSLLIDKLKQRNMLDKIEEYIFSDISPFFLRLGNIAIMNHAPQDFKYTIKKLDFNKPLVEQGIKENEIDIVYGVNALHAAKNIIITLREIYKIIKPGGLLIISECIRANPTDTLVQEIIFNLLEDYFNVEIDPYLRTTPGFLPYEQWDKIFRNSGFNNIEIILNTEGSYLENNSRIYPKLAAVIKGVKDLN